MDLKEFADALQAHFTESERTRVAVETLTSRVNLLERTLADKLPEEDDFVTPNTSRAIAAQIECALNDHKPEIERIFEECLENLDDKIMTADAVREVVGDMRFTVEVNNY